MATSYLQLSDTTDLKGLVQECEYLLGLADTAISGDAALLKHFYRSLNKGYRYALAVAFSSAGDWQYRGDNTASVSITAATRAYALASNLTNFLRINRVDIKYPSTGEYKKATQIDMKKVGSNGLDNYTTALPEFDLGGDYIDIYVSNKTADITAVTSGIKVYFDDDITDLATATTVADIPTPFLDIISLVACIDYCIRESMGARKADLKVELVTREAKFMEFIANRSEAKRSQLKQRRQDYGQQRSGINFNDVNTN